MFPESVLIVVIILKLFHAMNSMKYDVRLTQEDKLLRIVCTPSM